MKKIAAALLLFAPFAAQAVDLVKMDGKAILTDKDVLDHGVGYNETQKRNSVKDMTGRMRVVNTLIDQAVLVKEGEREKVDQEESFKAEMENYRKQLLAARVLERNLGSKLSASAVQKFYNDNKSIFSTDQVKAMHILVTDEEVAKTVLKKAKEQNTDEAFQKLAQSQSVDPSAKNNLGNLGFFMRDTFVPEFTGPIFEAKAGEVIGPLRTDYGFHVVRVQEKKTGRILDYPEVELKARDALRDRLSKEFVAKLRIQSKLSIDESAIKKF